MTTGHTPKQHIKDRRAIERAILRALRNMSKYNLTPGQLPPETQAELYGLETSRRRRA